MPRPVTSLACVQKSSSTSLISSRVAPFSAAIALPIFCTSRGPRNLKTSAASSSPRDIRRMAAFCTPSLLLLIAGYPLFDDVGDDFRVFLRDLFGAGERGLVAVGPR